MTDDKAIELLVVDDDYHHDKLHIYHLENGCMNLSRGPWNSTGKRLHLDQFEKDALLQELE